MALLPRLLNVIVGTRATTVDGLKLKPPECC